jgi:hypothetical protein
VVWVGVRAVSGLFTGDYLGGDYFQQAWISALVVWLAAFVVVQFATAFTLRRPVRGALGRELAAAVPADEAAELGRQLGALDDLERLVARAPRRN